MKEYPVFHQAEKGYDATCVDLLVRLVALTGAHHGEGPALSSNELLAMSLPVSFGGYDCGEVDQWLDDVASEWGGNAAGASPR